MREILFRGKPKTQEDYYYFSLNHKDSCKDGFVYGSLIVSGEKYFICVFAVCNLTCYVDNGTTSMVEVIPETVGQYTGLTDKNDKRIFEGDIVKFGGFEGEEIHSIGYVNGVFRLFDKKGYYSVSVHNYYSFVEVIGNIHDNPELLKGGVNNENNSKS